MKRAIIFANGRMEPLPWFTNDIKPSDLIIAADGGSHHCKSLGIIPDVIIGDLDSLDNDAVNSYRNTSVEIIEHPTHKDQTDLELALSLAIKRGITQVFILGALGNRWDMTISNVLLSAKADFTHLSIHFLDGSQELFILRGESRIDLDGRLESIISLIPIEGDCLGITTHGLEYPLDNETLYFGTSRGVSNVISKNQAHIYIKVGMLLICLSRPEAK